MDRLTYWCDDGVGGGEWRVNIHGEELAGEAVDRLAAYENHGLEPETIVSEPYGCVFYSNRRCNINNDWCAEGPGCPEELHPDEALKLLKLLKAEQDGRLVVAALRAQQEQENPEPLTLDELREMDGEPVWIVEAPEWGHWELSEDAWDYCSDREEAFYGMTYPNDPTGKYGLHGLRWLAYRHKPEED